MSDYKNIIFISCKHSLIIFIKQKQCIFQNFELPGCFTIKVKRKKTFVTRKGNVILLYYADRVKVNI